MDSSALSNVNASFSRLCHWDCELLFDQSSDKTSPPNIIDLLSFHDVSFDHTKTVNPQCPSFPSFCVYRFPSHYSGEYESTRKPIVEALKKSAINCGFKLFQGKSRKIKDGHSITVACVNNRVYYSPPERYKKNFDSGSLYADGLKTKTIRRNDKVESRGSKGLSMPRKTNTSKPTVLGKLCPFQINIFWSSKDSNWYLTKNASGRSHDNHPTCNPDLIMIDRKQMDADTRELALDCLKVHAKPSVTSKIIHQRTGQLFSSRQVSLLRKTRESLSAIAQDIVDKQRSSAEKLIDALETTESVSFFALFDDPESSLLSDEPGSTVDPDAIRRNRKKKTRSTNFWVTMRKNSGDPAVTEMLSDDVSNKALRNDGKLDAKERRDALSMRGGQAMLLACGWTTDDDVRLMQLFPEVFAMDLTFGTNRELRPLFKLAGIDANRENFTGINFFLPSKRRWVFNFLITEGIPILAGQQVISDQSLFKHIVCLFHVQQHNYRDMVMRQRVQRRHGMCLYHMQQRYFSVHTSTYQL